MYHHAYLIKLFLINKGALFGSSLFLPQSEAPYAIEKVVLVG